MRHADIRTTTNVYGKAMDGSKGLRLSSSLSMDRDNQRRRSHCEDGTEPDLALHNSLVLYRSCVPCVRAIIATQHVPRGCKDSGWMVGYSSLIRLWKRLPVN